eukprot:comp23263_c0_seq1/m.38026 comp23263_c0_seq1/g.38026  ORF comp23263_c0_seq1/g.38026 comp23263_c0_seq1/m.38026 type:complete len:379 (-) comp23263_c0_seq1:22-1158(-)
MALRIPFPLASTCLKHISAQPLGLRQVQAFYPSLTFAAKRYNLTVASVSLPLVTNKHRIYSTIAGNGDKDVPTDMHIHAQMDAHAVEPIHAGQLASTEVGLETGEKKEEKTGGEATPETNRQKRTEDRAEESINTSTTTSTSKTKKPKRLQNPYFLFVREKRAQVQEEMMKEIPDRGRMAMEVGRRLGAVWRGLTEEEREAYRAKFLEEVGPLQTMSHFRSLIGPSNTLPKRPITAFVRFMMAKRHETAAKLRVLLGREKIPMKIIMGRLSEDWALMFWHEKVPYHDDYKSAFEGYRRELMEWKKKVGFPEEQAKKPTFRTSWVHYFHTEGKKMREEHPEMDLFDQNFTLRMRWKKMSQEEKDEYAIKGMWYGKDDQV